MRRDTVRMAAIILVLVVGGCCLLYAGAKILLVIEARRAASLLKQLNKVQIGQSDSALSSLMNYEYPASELRDAGNAHTQILLVDPWHLRRPFSRYEWVDRYVHEAVFGIDHSRRRLGVRVWYVAGGVQFEQGKVRGVGAELVVEGKNEWLLASWNRVTEMPAYQIKDYKERGLYSPAMERYLVRWTHLHMGPAETGEGIRNWITPSATEVEQHAARTINLECLTSVSGCSTLCDLMPDATKLRRERNYPGWGGTSGSWAPQDRSCD